MKESILNFVPEGVVLRPNQIETLLKIEKNWNGYDVFVVQAPTGSGKSLIGGIAALWYTDQDKTAAIITPSIQQQEQLKATFPDFPSLKGKARYQCRQVPDMNCKRVYDLNGQTGYCVGCPYSTARRRAMSESISICNYYSFYSLKRNPDLLVVDEGHNLVDMVSDINTVIFSERRDGAPTGLGPRGDFLLWLEESHLYWASLDRTIMSRVQVINADRRQSKIMKILDRHYLYHLKREVNEDGTEKIVAMPRTAAGMSAVPWGVRANQKIIIMSATFNEHDAYRLGLKGKRISYIETDSPIAVDRRPVVYRPVADFTFRNKYTAFPLIAREIETIAGSYIDVKGIIHVPYADQKMFKQFFKKDKRFMFHNKNNKDKVYARFRQSKKPVVLFASGMAEGIDLPYDAARFQIIPKCLWAYLGDSKMKEIALQNPDLYVWLTMRTTLQQAGRICRAPDDWGVTFILDMTFSRLLYAKGKSQLPKYFTKALLISTDKEVLIPRMEDVTSGSKDVKQGQDLQEDSRTT